ncbi:unnamed protein product [Vicia faba]|uniref:ACT domain-containing protein ACR n=1 Tax=Vicia faba TaxID=3906 RepID=A0AAV1AWH4_VICFA|nr:unnamed protein product [Vicia faba]
MGIPWDDIVVIQHAKKSNEPTTVTVNCPDKAGLGCDLCRIILEFGLRITRADISTDGRWCYIIFWVIPHSESLKVDWESLKTRLLSPCPSCLFSYHFKQQSANPSPNQIYLLKVWIFDQKGLLYDINEILCNLLLTIQRVKVMPTPDGRALDLFFITDEMELFHTKKRRDDVCEYLMEALGEKCISSELQLAGPEYDGHLPGFSSLPPAYSEELFGPELSDKVSLHPLSQDMTTLKKPSVTVDNTLSPTHTLLQIQCVDQKGLCYDIMRIAKDPRFERLLCTHKGTYADDCLVERVNQHKCFIVATCDRDLKRRIRKIPGVPIMYITKHRYSIERLPEATIGGAPRI